MTHPARYSPQIIDALRPILADAPHIHDPFAGTGERLGALCDELGVTFSGTEIEAPFIVDRRVECGDSRDEDMYPRRRRNVLTGRYSEFWIVTSPTYGNRMNDDYRPSDTSKRYFYRKALIDLTSDPDARLQPGNTGAHGYRSKASAERYWQLNREVVAQWGHAERVIVNVSDFYMRDERIPIVRGWKDLLVEHGWDVLGHHEVETPRMRNGANSGKRAEHEAIIVAVRT